MLGVGEDLLDGVEVWGVFGEEEELGAGRADGQAHRPPLVAAEVIHHDDVAWPQARDEDLLDIETEPLAVDRAVEQPRRLEAIATEGGEKGHGLPASLGHLRAQPLAAWTPASQRRHIGLGPGLVAEAEPGRVDPVLVGFPMRPPPRNVWTMLLAGDQRLFLKLSFSARTKVRTAV